MTCFSCSTKLLLVGILHTKQWHSRNLSISLLGERAPEGGGGDVSLSCAPHSTGAQRGALAQAAGAFAGAPLLLAAAPGPWARPSWQPAPLPSQLIATGTGSSSRRAATASHSAQGRVALAGHWELLLAPQHSHSAWHSPAEPSRDLSQPVTLFCGQHHQGSRREAEVWSAYSLTGHQERAINEPHTETNMADINNQISQQLER